ncbi:helix-turn-helix domain-containing protein [Luteolibacter luteus]|uniref:Helix-turn-helix domain-containing protein n=1 Tax=Luteolibacter luteus TaxID=2728835 RepID=A0A858RDA6_9BACT|nr:helix-turn-helix domain-containing protein [Luteolibacter luteus]QJE94379.1 helix-turn-helix domain-containing protein [Luteolibacter luteus]
MSKNSALKLGVVVRESYLRSRFSVFEGVMDYCLENTGLKAFLIPLQEGCEPAPDALAEVSGVVIWAAPSDGAWVLPLWERGVPVVSCNNAFNGQVPTVSAGEPYELAYQYLLSLQRHTIGFVTRPEIDEECRVRFNSRIESEERQARIFKGVRKDPGRFPEHLLAGTDEVELERFLISLPKPAALWCIHDEMAALVWRKAEELGISVPGELALLGMGDHPCAVHSTPGISTVRIPGIQLGQAAARLLHGHLFGSSMLTHDLTFSTEQGALLVERLSTGGSNPINRGIQRAWRLLENYPSEGLTVDCLIEKSRASRATFYKEFERAFNMPPGKAIRLFRTKKAKEHLLSTDLPISQIGRMCGFSSESDFSNFFKRETGQTPKEWRRSRQLHEGGCTEGDERI